MLSWGSRVILLLMLGMFREQRVLLSGLLRRISTFRTLNWARSMELVHTLRFELFLLLLVLSCISFFRFLPSGSCWIWLIYLRYRFISSRWLVVIERSFWFLISSFFFSFVFCFQNMFATWWRTFTSVKWEVPCFDELVLFNAKKCFDKNRHLHYLETASEP